MTCEIIRLLNKILYHIYLNFEGKVFFQIFYDHHQEG